MDEKQMKRAAQELVALCDKPMTRSNAARMLVLAEDLMFFTDKVCSEVFAITPSIQVEKRGSGKRAPKTQRVDGGVIAGAITGASATTKPLMFGNTTHTVVDPKVKRTETVSANTPLNTKAASDVGPGLAAINRRLKRATPPRGILGRIQKEKK